MMISKEQLQNMELAELVSKCIDIDAVLKNDKKILDAFKAEIQSRAETDINDHNLRFVKYYGEKGSASVMDSLTLDVLNVDRLHDLISEGVWKQKVTETTQTKYKFQAALERALKAIFTEDYVNDMTLNDVVDDILSYVQDSDGNMKKVLLKKLKGDYQKDKKLIADVVYGGDDTKDLDTHLWLIYKIKNWQLITMFFPEEGIDGTLDAVKKCVIVENKTALTLDYE